MKRFIAGLVLGLLIAGASARADWGGFGGEDRALLRRITEAIERVASALERAHPAPTPTPSASAVEIRRAQCIARGRVFDGGVCKGAAAPAAGAEKGESR